MDRKDRISAYAAGGFTGGPVMGSAENMHKGLPLANLPDEEFIKISDLVDRIEKRQFNPDTCQKFSGDFSFYVDIHIAGKKTPKNIYNSGDWAQAVPAEVFKLIEIVDAIIEKNRVAAMASIAQPPSQG